MRRWRLPSAKRLRFPSSASGDDTRSRLETNDVDRARGWPLVWFIFVGRGCGPLTSRAGRKGLVKYLTASRHPIPAKRADRNCLRLRLHAYA